MKPFPQAEMELQGLCDGLHNVWCYGRGLAQDASRALAYRLPWVLGDSMALGSSSARPAMGDGRTNALSSAMGGGESTAEEARKPVSDGS